MKTYTATLLLVALCFTATLQHRFLAEEDEHHDHPATGNIEGPETRCIHDEIEHTFEIDNADEDHEGKGRNLQTATPHPITFYPDTSYFGTNATDVMIRNLVQAAIAYLNRVLNVTCPILTIPRKFVSTSTYCSLPPSSFMVNTGTTADYILLVATTSSATNYIATGGACNLDGANKFRPYIGKITFNYAFVRTGSEVNWRNNLATTIHEIIHALGFTNSLFQYYPNPYTYTTITLPNGVSQANIRFEPMTSYLRSYFNCASIPGTYLENQGGTGSAGSHLERRIFFNDIMTASHIKDLRVTNFTLMFLNSTGWYGVNYSFVDPFNYGRNKGCGFYNGSCVDSVTKVSPFTPEYCTALTQAGCTFYKRQGGVCGNGVAGTGTVPFTAWNYWGNSTVVADIFADNCPQMYLYSTKDCEDVASSTTESFERFGLGSRCFPGTLSSLSVNYMYTRPTPFCLRSFCSAKVGGGFNLLVTINSTNVTCTTAGAQITVPNYRGYLECPDPTDFCSNHAPEFCRLNCMGRGTCVNNVCVCNAGFKGEDCSQNV